MSGHCHYQPFTFKHQRKSQDWIICMQIDSFPKGTMALSDHQWQQEMEKEVETKTRCHNKEFMSILDEIFFDNTERKETKQSLTLRRWCILLWTLILPERPDRYHTFHFYSVIHSGSFTVENKGIFSHLNVFEDAPSSFSLQKKAQEKWRQVKINIVWWGLLCVEEKSKSSITSARQNPNHFSREMEYVHCRIQDLYNGSIALTLSYAVCLSISFFTCNFFFLRTRTFHHFMQKGFTWVCRY